MKYPFWRLTEQIRAAFLRQAYPGHGHGFPARLHYDNKAQCLFLKKAWDSLTKAQQLDFLIKLRDRHQQSVISIEQVIFFRKDNPKGF